MKKIIIMSFLGSLVLFSCKKKYSDPSTEVKASFPTISVSGASFYSIGVGGNLPTIAATAYDSTLMETCTVSINQSALDNTTPGLYEVTLQATNKYGYTSYSGVYVGVTSASSSLDLSGWWVRGGVPTKAAYYTKLGTGLFLTTNVGGVDTVSQASALVSAVFVVTSDSTVDFGSQQTTAGLLQATNEVLSLVATDTTLSYILANPSSTFNNTAVRTFVKQ